MEFASANSLADHINELGNKSALSELVANFCPPQSGTFFCKLHSQLSVTDISSSENTFTINRSVNCIRCQLDKQKETTIRQAYSSHHQIVIWICFWFDELNNNLRPGWKIVELVDCVAPREQLSKSIPY